MTDSKKKKIVALTRRALRIKDDAKAENLATGARRKEALDTLYEEAEKAGFGRRPFKLHMKRTEHLRNADSVRSDISDEEVLQVFDTLGAAMEFPGLAEATAEAEEKHKTKRAKAAATADDSPATTTDGGRVVALHS